MPIAELLAATKIDRLDAEILLAFVLRCSRAKLLTLTDSTVAPTALAEFEKLVARRAAGEPVAYLTGRKEFFGLEFIVNSSVLIPRPETEQLVEEVIREVLGIRFQGAGDKNLCSVLDIGTGSGCVAISIAYHLPGIAVFASDVSREALAVARKNAATHGAEVKFYESDLLARVPGEFSIVVANLPYIAEADPTVAPAVKKYEPKLALFGGQTGLELHERSLQQIAAWRVRPRLLIFEIGWRQREAVFAIVKKYLPGSKVECLKDLAGHDRIVKVMSS